MATWLTSADVAVAKAATAAYPSTPPFHPPEVYPELAVLLRKQSDKSDRSDLSDTSNAVYPAVRAALLRLGGPASNPLEGIVQPGDTVVVKPNFIRECHETRTAEWEQVITHGAVIRAVCDYVLLALAGRGKVIICDAPQTDSSFEAVCRVSGARAVVDWYASWSPVPVGLLDLRTEEWEEKDTVIIRRRTLPGDPAGYVAVSLGAHSAFAGIEPRHGFYGADYDTTVTTRHHHGDVHEYLLSATVMNADVVINLPKLKTHKKTGLTCALKNLVGINGDKNWLPHYMLGSRDEGGDQFPAGTVRARSERVLMTAIKKLLARAPAWLNHLFRPFKSGACVVWGDTHRVIRSGNWHGNDTTWRMVLDLNAAFFHCARPVGECRAKHGRASLNVSATATAQRRYLTLVDGIVAGEGDGPLAPDAKPCGIIIAGLNPVAVDTVAAWLMGFDPAKLRLLSGAWEAKAALCAFAPEALTVASDVAAWCGPLTTLDPATSFRFTPHFGWKGAIERQGDEP